MDELRLTYEQDDAPNGSGYLHIDMRAGGFTGRCSTYVAEEWLIEFAQRLSVYPLPVKGVSFSTEVDDAEIAVHSLGSLGHLKVAVKLTSNVSSRVIQHAELQMEADYATLERFCNAIVVAVKTSSGEVVLQSIL